MPFIWVCHCLGQPRWLEALALKPMCVAPFSQVFPHPLECWLSHLLIVFKIGISQPWHDDYIELESALLLRLFAASFSCIPWRPVASYSPLEMVKKSSDNVQCHQIMATWDLIAYMATYWASVLWFLSVKLLVVSLSVHILFVMVAGPGSLGNYIMDK